MIMRLCHDIESNPVDSYELAIQETATLSRILWCRVANWFIDARVMYHLSKRVRLLIG